MRAVGTRETVELVATAMGKAAAGLSAVAATGGELRMPEDIVAALHPSTSPPSSAREEGA